MYEMSKLSMQNSLTRLNNDPAHSIRNGIAENKRGASKLVS